MPLVASLPLHDPLAVQEVALVELHVSVELPPKVTVMGLALKVTVGRGLLPEQPSGIKVSKPESRTNRQYLKVLRRNERLFL